MITIPQAVNDIVKGSPFLEEGLSSGLINLSALARKIKPEIEERLFKEIEIGAIVMALKRLATELPLSNKRLTDVLSQISDVTVRSSIIEFTFVNSVTLPGKISLILSEIQKEPNSFLTVTDGVFETSLFISSSLKTRILTVFQDENIKKQQENLSSITLILPKESSDISGVYYSILKKLAWEGINIIEVASSFTELTIFLDKKDIDKAFSALKKLS